MCVHTTKLFPRDHLSSTRRVRAFDVPIYIPYCINNIINARFCNDITRRCTQSIYIFSTSISFSPRYVSRPPSRNDYSSIDATSAARVRPPAGKTSWSYLEIDIFRARARDGLSRIIYIQTHTRARAGRVWPIRTVCSIRHICVRHIIRIYMYIRVL